MSDSVELNQCLSYTQRLQNLCLRANLTAIVTNIFVHMESQAALCQEGQTFRLTKSGNPVGYWWPRGLKDLIHGYGLQYSHSGLSHGREVTDALQIKWSLEFHNAKNALPWT